MACEILPPLIKASQMTQTLSRRNPKPSRVMNVLYSTFVAGTSSPPLSLFLLSGHVLDVACCLLEESSSSGGLVHRGCYCSLIFKLSDNSCRKNYIWLLISVKISLDGCFSKLTQVLSAVLASGPHKTYENNKYAGKFSVKVEVVGMRARLSQQRLVGRLFQDSQESLGVCLSESFSHISRELLCVQSRS